MYHYKMTRKEARALSFKEACELLLVVDDILKLEYQNLLNIEMYRHVSDSDRHEIVSRIETSEDKKMKFVMPTPQEVVEDQKVLQSHGIRPLRKKHGT